MHVTALVLVEMNELTLVSTAAVGNGLGVDWANILNALRDAGPVKDAIKDCVSATLNRQQECQVEKKMRGRWQPVTRTLQAVRGY